MVIIEVTAWSIAAIAFVLFCISVFGAYVACRSAGDQPDTSKSTCIPAKRIKRLNEVLIRGDASELPVLRARVAASLWQRTRGLLLRPIPGPGHALLLHGCWSIHTLGMMYPIDVVFFDARMRVTRVATVPPLRVAVFGRGGRHALEMAPGEARRLRIAVGQHLHFQHVCEQVA